MHFFFSLIKYLLPKIEQSSFNISTVIATWHLPLEIMFL